MVVSRLKPAQQLVERGQDLLSKLRGDQVLVLAAVGKNGGQALLFRHREEPFRTEQHVQGGEDGPACHLGQLGDDECQITA